MKKTLFSLILLCFAGDYAIASDKEDLAHGVLPVLDKLCFDCHEPGISKGNVPLLETETLADLATMREVWRDAAVQLQNRTMPPPDKDQPTDEERAFISNWINNYLIKTACDQGPYAGYVTARRLNRFEYDNTVKDLLGVDLGFRHSLPIDTGAGEGFNNNGESLFLPPMLMERYLEAAQKIVDAAIITPRREIIVEAKDFHQTPNGSAALVPIYVEGSYKVGFRVNIAKGVKTTLAFAIDGLPVRKIKFERKTGSKKGHTNRTIDIKLGRGEHLVALASGNETELIQIRISQEEKEIPKKVLANHQAVFGLKPREQPVSEKSIKRSVKTFFGLKPNDARGHVRKRLLEILPRAWRRPVEDAEVERFLKLYDRAEERGDPFEECFKLALRGILVSPDFLFRMEHEPSSKKIKPITDHELAVRLSYFLWSTMPDAELKQLADKGKLNDDKVLREQVERMLDDPRSLRFAREFVGQWLGTKDVGGRVAPVTNNNQDYYTNEVAADMREEGVRIFHHLVTENRPVLELVSADYTFLTRRLGEFYGIKDAKKLPKEEFQLVRDKDSHRGGVLALGGVLAMTSHEKNTSPVLRGAWVFDTLIGTPVPPPPADVPEFIQKKDGKKLTDREKLALHRDKPACLTCHQLIDPIGFALQNYDQYGRWRTKENGKEVDATGRLPGGKSFSGLSGLKETLLTTRIDDMERQFARKLLGYGLGRNLVERDDCTITKLIAWMKKNDYLTRGLIQEIVLSTPFRNRQRVDLPLKDPPAKDSPPAKSDES